VIEVPVTLFIDGEALVVDKPAGLDVDTPKRGGFSLVSMLGALRFGFKREPSAVHRLDRDTSGCLLLARHPKAHARFAKAFEDGLVEKVYLGILDGVPEQRDGTIELSLAKQSSKERGWRMIAAKAGKTAVTHWRVVAEEHGKALVEFRPETGRTHQLRAHALYGIGIPLMGDPVYGTGEQTLLHASAIRLQRDGKDPVEAHAPLPKIFLSHGFSDPQPALHTAPDAPKAAPADEADARS
jgi:tRNA pseudouridine32 synthase/23S rRNA pseudouridine746 synthase